MCICFPSSCFFFFNDTATTEIYTLSLHDALPIFSRLKGAGAILLGNTNTPEYLMAYETNNLLAGKTSNPWNLAHSAGGSSGGEAAAIAAGCSVGGVCSEDGGSVRVPAHFCGICGLKPTPGRIPATGHFPPGAGAFSWIGVVGPMARTVADVRSLFEVIAGPDAGDALSAPVPSRAYREAELRGMRIGILESDALGVATAETRAAVERAAKSLGERGFTVEPFRLDGLACALDLWWFFFGPVIGNLICRSVAGHEDQISPMLREYLSCATSGNSITLDQFTEACADRDLLRAEILRQMRDTPILLSPVSTSPAFRHGQGNYLPGTGYRDTMRFSQWLNLTGFPGASVPVTRLKTSWSWPSQKPSSKPAARGWCRPAVLPERSGSYCGCRVSSGLGTRSSSCESRSLFKRPSMPFCAAANSTRASLWRPSCIRIRPRRKCPPWTSGERRSAVSIIFKAGCGFFCF